MKFVSLLFFWSISVSLIFAIQGFYYQSIGYYVFSGEFAFVSILCGLWWLFFDKRAKYRNIKEKLIQEPVKFDLCDDEVTLVDKLSEIIETSVNTISAKVFWTIHYYLSKKKMELTEQEVQTIENMIQIRKTLFFRCRSCGSPLKSKEDLTQCPFCKSPICQKCLEESKREAYSKNKLESLFGVK